MSYLVFGYLDVLTNEYQTIWKHFDQCKSARIQLHIAHYLATFSSK